MGTTGAAGLASVETLDDGAQEKNNAAAAGGEDGMETVRLDAEAADGPPAKPHPLVVCLTAARRNVIVSGERASNFSPSFWRFFFVFFFRGGIVDLWVISAR